MDENRAIRSLLGVSLREKETGHSLWVRLVNAVSGRCPSAVLFLSSFGVQLGRGRIPDLLLLLSGFSARIC